MKTHSTANRFVIRPETVLFLRRVRASFSPESLQAGDVKGLKDKAFVLRRVVDHTPSIAFRHLPPLRALLSGTSLHSEHRFPAPSSKLCQI